MLRIAPGENRYTQLLEKPCGSIAEAKTPYLLFTERHLQALWLEQKYVKTFETEDGKQLEVISPGIWNQEAGPDFLKAHLRLGGQNVIGDVELHLASEDWLHHKHHLDERYNHVVLHVFLWQPRSYKAAVTLKGHTLPALCLEKYLTVPLARLLHLIDLDLYPYRKFVGSGRCGKTLFRKIPEEKIIDLFEAAADWRLMQKRRFLMARAEDPEQAFSAGMAMVFGYKHNADTFLTLFLTLHSQRALGEDLLLALAMGACGFFDGDYAVKWKDSDRYGYLRALYMMRHVMGQTLKPCSLVNLSTRPLNHPIRRLACLVKFIVDPRQGHFFHILRRLWSAHWQLRTWRELKIALLAALPSYGDEYWNSHYSFEPGSAKQPLTLIGAPTKEAMLVNAFFPLLRGELAEYAAPEEVHAFKEFYHSLKASYASKTRYLQHRFFGDTVKGELLKRADLEQGAYQVHRDFCIHFEASCEGCPFVERYGAIHHQENYVPQTR